MQVEGQNFTIYFSPMKVGTVLKKIIVEKCLQSVNGCSLQTNKVQYK
jgi:hypothetical protein